MNCTFCGKNLSVHLLDPGEGGWQDRLYCSACRSFQHVPGDAVCPYCSSTYRNFLATGRLGCAHCYDIFAADLDPLIEQYHAAALESNSATEPPADDPESPQQRPARHSYAPDRLARTRSQEIVRLLEESGPGSPSAVPIEGPPVGRPATSAGFSGDQAFPGALPGESARGLPLQWRVRAARNIAGLPYRLNARQRELLDAVLLSPGSSLAACLPAGLGPLLRGTELERLQAAGILPVGARAAASGRGNSRPAGDAGGPEPELWAYTGDEDHLRLQWRGAPGGSAGPAADYGVVTAAALDAIFAEIAEIDELFAFQYHPEYGFLTACPGIGGAAIRVSFLLDVRNLMAKGIWPEYRRRLLASGLELRGSRGEDGTAHENSGDSADFGGLVQISNRFWPVDADVRGAARRLLTIAQRIAAADFREGGQER